jgi:hypothetical protein
MSSSPCQTHRHKGTYPGHFPVSPPAKSPTPLPLMMRLLASCPCLCPLLLTIQSYRFILLAPKDKDHYNPIMDLEKSLYTIVECEVTLRKSSSLFSQFQQTTSHQSNKPCLAPFPTRSFPRHPLHQPRHLPHPLALLPPLPLPL